ncbi:MULTISPECIES: aldo/keto reductase [Mammaliicoccus]|uniref:aldo/keto reductase n=1 Tax=Mammaliicoccus TaxID=2803850 RepID=UPI000D1D6D81|nr:MULTISPECIES: aldo/keto reductase [Mammaliicoccus]MCD8818378.1 aldo/keto reductase [Mammaliicoccus sciuri]MCE5041887.1 aldo/keto reductase [Mammaliicoccus sciuri]MCE5058813.1 aldo/keto reductase [Mammaliicoccus sciuri]MEB5759782.1 aldo/keto reductase [Mammaliicoccus sciuri]MEB7408439.1 aldo/keto reductase [Mammaliicoccus sciuri]
MNYTTFHNGNTMPNVGLGVFRVENDDTAKDAVKHAIISGYRSIDAAFIYGNESKVGEGIAEGIKAANISREDLFITSKLWLEDYGKENVKRAYEKSLKLLGLDYLDLYLMHWPGTDENLMLDTWIGLEELYQQKLVNNIGVSNFNIDHLEILSNKATYKPVLNQVEFHPYLTQLELRNYLDRNSIQMESWSPLMNSEILKDNVVNQIAREINKTPAQVIIRWNIEHGVITIPKSITPSRIEENFDVFNFKLNDTHIRKLDELNKGKRIGPNPNKFNG